MGSLSMTAELSIDRLVFKGQSQPYDNIECYEYNVVDDPNRDIAVIRVLPGCTTPRQLVLWGEKTIESFVCGIGTLVVESLDDGLVAQYEFADDTSDDQEGVVIETGQIMQWQAGESGLVFVEVCEPPYEDGRFENI